MSHHDKAAAIPLEDIFIDATSQKITTPIPCPRFQPCKCDNLEFALGYNRGEMDFLLATEKCFSITIRQDVCESLFKMHSWGILSDSEDQYDDILAFFESNYKAGVKKRVMYTQKFIPQPTYTYRLYFNNEFVQFHLPDGRPCISGETLVTTTLHPCIAAIIARDFTLMNSPADNLEKATEDILRWIECSLTRPLFLSWFQECKRLAKPRPQTRAIYDCPVRAPKK